MKITFMLLLLVRNLTNFVNADKTHPLAQNEAGNETKHDEHGISLASWRFDEYRMLSMGTVLIFVGAVFKITLHHWIFTKIIHLPESCLIIILGMISGAVVHYVADPHSVPEFTSSLFFNVLLPPIILGPTIKQAQNIS